MPRGQPFTQLCQQLAAAAQPIRADLHCHSTQSDGDSSPSQLVMLARQARLTTLAITDHDALTLTACDDLELIPAVEFSTLWNGREWHILGYGLDPKSTALQVHLQQVQAARRQRFLDFVSQFQARGLRLPDGLIEIVQAKHLSLGRRHLAKLLIQAGQAATSREAFVQWIAPTTPKIEARHLTPLAEVIELIHSFGGQAVLAHPPKEFDLPQLAELGELGLDGVESRFPAATPGFTLELESLARTCGLFCTGGSDFHGSDTPGRQFASHGLNHVEMNQLREIFRSRQS